MSIPGKMIKGMGGAMDLVHGARRVIVVIGDVRDRTAAPVIIPAEFTTATGAPAGGLS